LFQDETSWGNQKMGVLLSSTQRHQIDSIEKFISGSLSRKDCALFLNLSERSVSRIASAIKKEGITAILHGNSGQVPMNKTSSEIKTLAHQYAIGKYYDFNILHMLEKLRLDIDLNISYSTFRKWCHEWKIIKRTRNQRKQNVHKHRERHHCEGFMLQMDGSEHMFWKGETTVLIAAIDDATSDVPYGEFYKSEDTINCMDVVEKIIKIKGIPKYIYTDRAGWLAGTKRQDFTQFSRACEELGIEVISANSAQAKGRIERLWGYLQDRLIVEMRINNINTTAAANIFFNNYMQTEWKNKHTVTAFKKESAYRSIPINLDLNEIFCMKYDRRVALDHTISWKGEKFLIKNPPFNLTKKDVEIRFYKNKTSKVFFAGRVLELEKVHKHSPYQLNAA
jgi:transposase